MFREMRRKKQKLTEKQCLAILRRAKTATLALHGDDGYPYSVPVNFVYEDGKIYFHGAKEGHKIDAIKNNPKVSMSIIDQEDVIEEELTTYFRSVILFGKARILQEDDEIYHAIETLGLKYNEDEVAVEKKYEKNGKFFVVLKLLLNIFQENKQLNLLIKTIKICFRFLIVFL